MNRQRFEQITVAFFAFSVFFAGLGLFFFFLKSDPIQVSEIPPKERPLPTNAFARPVEDYEKIDSEFLSIQSAPPSIQIPELKGKILYFGPNGRPDLSENGTVLHFGLSDTRDQTSIPAEEPLYLMFDQKRSPPGYIFSPSNQPTSLWIVGLPKEGEASVEVKLKDPDGSLVTEPKERATVQVKEQPFARFGIPSNWKIGDLRVDATLLARQRTTWYGDDLFLKDHGGDEFKDVAEKQLINIGRDENTYSLYMGIGDYAYWNGSRWVVAESNDESRGKPLLNLKKMDSRLLTFDLWAPNGDEKVTLNVLKSRDPWIPQKLEKEFSFVSARTRSQYVFEIQNQRVILRPFDWLIFRDGKWKKLSTPQEIDDYVDRKFDAPLFIFNGLDEETQQLTGTLYNGSRTDKRTVILTEKGDDGVPKPPVSSEVNSEKNIPQILKTDEVSPFDLQKRRLDESPKE